MTPVLAVVLAEVLLFSIVALALGVAALVAQRRRDRGETNSRVEVKEA
jgi:hypothetical protein